jgi:hypothetical protein
MPPIDDAKWEDKLPLRREEMQNCLSSLLKGISLPQGEGGKGGREGLRVPLPADAPRVHSSLCAAGGEWSRRRGGGARQLDGTAELGGAEELLGGRFDNSRGSSPCVRGRFSGGRARFNGRGGAVAVAWWRELRA